MSTSPAVLLVHGAWHGSWCWDAVRPLLESSGRAIHTVDLPTVHAEDKTSRGVADDAVVVREAIEAIDGPVVVVAHSYGGIPASVAAADQPSVRHIVYVTAFALDEGESLLGAVGGVAPSWWRIDGDLVSTGTEEDPAAHVFFNDVSADVAEAAVARLKPQSLRAFTDTLTAAAWHTVPSTYLITERDNAIPVFAQEQLAARAGSTVHRIDTGHSPFYAAPEAATELILAAGLDA
ncbi:alpha/beta fold hydrolase [Microbacterium sp. ASV49]|uniref:Alpha/beta hydrolase n=1 Tax=Microbacterium candidum TaxID=3041922 RepID=A0ABT7MVJ9_9MICO|nr:alpha/beta hydrolase [Microbacterium sp. ASV49]MDL9978476.1 alpha/beta hydrolase [Microbacterium sp. ASV49]